jgi:hypothetical protein
MPTAPRVALNDTAEQRLIPIVAALSLHGTHTPHFFPSQMHDARAGVHPY